MKNRKIIRLTKVEELTGLSGRTIHRKEAAGKFPLRVSLGPNSVGWYEDEVFEWNATRERGGGTTPTAAIQARG